MGGLSHANRKITRRRSFDSLRSLRMTAAMVGRPWPFTLRPFLFGPLLFKELRYA
jgi:hypothetical protein